MIPRCNKVKPIKNDDYLISKFYYTDYVNNISEDKQGIS